MDRQTQWPKEKGQKHKQSSTKHTHIITNQMKTSTLTNNISINHYIILGTYQHFSSVAIVFILSYIFKAEQV